MYGDKDTHDFSIGYGAYVLIWLILLSLLTVTVGVAGLHLGEFTLFIALLVAAIKSGLVITVFMHIKFEEAIFKVFLSVTGMILLVVFVITSFDIFNR